jgi:uracil-DNA glycosylase
MVMTLHKSWHEPLKKELSKPYIKNLKRFLEKEKETGYVVYPPESLVFNAFSQTPFDQVKVVIIGQDPYHGKGQAEGLCFSVPKGISVPPSLKNIYKEIEADLGFPPPNHGCLLSWAKQGVLLLNATLTVREKSPRSHYGKGWETFTDSVVESLCQKKDPIVFLLWGKSAQEKCENILNKSNHPHIILSCSHPSPYSAKGFLGCRHFSKTNQYLANFGKTPINWRVDN